MFLVTAFVQSLWLLGTQVYEYDNENILSIIGIMETVNASPLG